MYTNESLFRKRFFVPTVLTAGHLQSLLCLKLQRNRTAKRL